MNIRRLTGIYIIKDDKILLMHKQKSRVFSKPLWMSVGGHFENVDQGDPDKCIIREMQEETGIGIGQLENFIMKYITIRKTASEIRLQYVYFASLKCDKTSIKQTDEGKLKWIEIDELFNRNMSVTNTALLKHYLETGTNDDFVYSGSATAKNGTPFIEFKKLKEFEVSY